MRMNFDDERRIRNRSLDKASRCSLQMSDDDDIETLAEALKVRPHYASAVSPDDC